MSDQITYDDKADLIVDTTIDDMFKVSASDMNEIKSVVNANAQEMDDNNTEVQDDIAVINDNITDLNNNKLDADAVKNEASTETDEVYSSNYLNDKLVSVGTTSPTGGERVWFAHSHNLLSLVDGTYTANGITAVVDNGVVTMNGTATANAFVAINLSPQLDVSLNETITISANNPVANSNIRLRVDSGGYQDTTLNEVNKINTFEVTSALMGNTISFRVQNGTTLNDYVIKPQIQLGSTATTYEPYVEEGIYVDEEKMHFDNYSTNEQIIGKWIDGKTLYRKVITFGALANNGNKTIPYGSSNNLIKFDIYAKNPTSGYLFKVPLGGTNYINSYVDLNFHQIVVQTNSDRTAVTDNYAIVEYTKTTD